MPLLSRVLAFCLVGMASINPLAAATPAAPKAPSLPAETCPVPDERPEVEVVGQGEGLGEGAPRPRARRRLEDRQ